MILVDANLLIYSYSRKSPYHARSIAWWSEVLNDGTRVGIPWHCLIAFLRIMTKSKPGHDAITMPQAWATVESWLGHSTVWVPQPTERHAKILGRLLLGGVRTSRMVSDAHLAALSIEHNLTLCTNDGDFTHFPGLHWKNPLQR